MSETGRVLRNRTGQLIPFDLVQTPQPKEALPPIVSTTEPERAVVCFGELDGRAMCDAEMVFHQKRQRGRYGVSSPGRHSSPCPRRAVVRVLYDDDTVATRCAAHAPGRPD